MSKSKVVQVVGDKIVPVTGPIVVLPADAPSNEATIIGVDFALRKMDRMHKDAIAARSKKHPLDASLQAFMRGEDGKVVAESGFLFYGQPHYAGGVGELVAVGPLSRFHSTMRLRLGAVPQEVQRIALISSVHDTEHHHIGMFGVMSMYICKGNLEPQGIHLFREFPRGHGAVVLGELSRVDGNWQFAADGETVQGGLRELCGRYAVRLEDDEEKAEAEKSE